MPKQEPGSWKVRAATDAEVAACLKAIADAHPGAIPEKTTPEVRVAGTAPKESFYVNIHPPQDLAPGTVYRTWIVDFSSGEKPTVTWFRSRRGDQSEDGKLLGDRNEITLPLVSEEETEPPAEEEATSPGADGEDTPAP